MVRSAGQRSNSSGWHSYDTLDHHGGDNKAPNHYGIYSSDATALPVAPGDVSPRPAGAIQRRDVTSTWSCVAAGLRGEDSPSWTRRRGLVSRGFVFHTRSLVLRRRWALPAGSSCSSWREPQEVNLEILRRRRRRRRLWSNCQCGNNSDGDPRGQKTGSDVAVVLFGSCEVGLDVLSSAGPVWGSWAWTWALAAC